MSISVCPSKRPSGSSKVIVTSAMPMASRPSAPLKITSVIAAPRRLLARWSPNTHLMASTTLDLPQPLGPMMPVKPESNSNSVLSANDLKPRATRRLSRTR